MVRGASYPQADISPDAWQALQHAPALRVTYDTRDPQVHRVAGQKLAGWRIVFLIILGVIPGAAGAILVAIGFSRLRDRV